MSRKNAFYFVLSTYTLSNCPRKNILLKYACTHQPQTDGLASSLQIMIIIVIKHYVNNAHFSSLASRLVRRTSLANLLVFINFAHLLSNYLKSDTLLLRIITTTANLVDPEQFSSIQLHEGM